MAEIKAALFDLDHTVYDYSVCNDFANTQVAKKLSSVFNKSEEEITRAFHAARKEVKAHLGETAASHSRFLYLQKTIESLKGKTDLALTHEAYDLFWESFMEKMKLNPGVIDFFDHLRKIGIKIAVITDLTAPIQFRKMLRLGIKDHVDFVITSEEAGKDKPHDPIFSLALKKLGCTKEEVVVIGDDLDREIQWAKKYGVMNIHVSHHDFRLLLEHFKTMKNL
ncbi:MAG: HAD family hydrolase [Candidatus Micrarchaeia archaeon]